MIEAALKVKLWKDADRPNDGERSSLLAGRRI
jgi:hypothetical protein